MLRRKVVRAPDGTVWTIRRRWIRRPGWRGRSWPWRRKRESDPDRGGRWDLLDLFNFNFDFGDDIAAGILIVLLVAAFVVFMIFFGWPLLLFLFESLLIIPITFVAGIVGRVLFRRPWAIEATAVQATEETEVAWSVAGWRASSRAADQMAAAIRATGDVADDPPLVTPRAHRKSRR